MEKIVIVNDKDKVIGCKDRYKSNCRTDIYRVSALWIENKKGEILLARRSLTKKHNSGKWGPAVAGTNADGETYKLNIIKESREELGLINVNPLKLRKEFVKNKYQHFTQWFYIILNDVKEFQYQKEEVEEIRWFKEEDLLVLTKNNPSNFLEGMEKWIKEFKLK
jgi:isopentenyl-diphosphate delta-isomerase